MSDSKTILSVKNLRKYFPTRISWPQHESRGFVGKIKSLVSSKKALIKAVDGVNFEIQQGETLGLVGESGCGKSTLGRTILKLLQPTDGSIIFNGKDITHLSQSQMRPIRQDIQIIFQDPYASLNPRMTVGAAICEPLDVFDLVQNSKEKNKRLDELLDKVGLPKDAKNRYPHEFSGGQRQRVGIAPCSCR